jgi:zinc transport system substrate-binding protein
MFSEYDWVMQILGERSSEVEVTMLLDSGVDLHSYQPTVDDLVKIASCDLFIYVGGESDSWAADALKNATNKNMKVINIFELLGDDLLDDTDHHHEEGEEHGHDHAKDEHVWLSLKNAKKICQRISQVLCEIDAENKETYEKNYESYAARLTTLDAEYSLAVSALPVNTMLFADRFPFRYMFHDYYLEYYAAFSGCSAESEASFETISFLASKIDELGLKYVITIDGSSSNIADTVIATSTAKTAEILVLDSMQSKTSKDIAAGETYLSVMTKNLATVKKALS